MLFVGTLIPMESENETGNDSYSAHGATLREIISLLAPLDQNSRRRLLRTLATYFDIAETEFPTLGSTDRQPRMPLTPSEFSTRATLSPKQFMVEKVPVTDIERIACLAFYLTHYRDTAQFESADLIALNTEAAQARFANAHWTINNAMKQGYLAGASKGKKQISAGGEQFVLTLPDRDAAKAAMQRIVSRRSRRSKPKKAQQDRSQDDSAEGTING
jgi:hypothetical protein